MDIIIRQETAEDFTEIYNLVKSAFKTAKVTNGREQDFVNDLRGGECYIPELSLVAEDNGNVVGHIMLSGTYIVSNEAKLSTLLLAPVAVALEYRNKGIGARLINEGLRLAKELGYSSVFLVGDPRYYNRLGFRTSMNFGIRNSHKIPDEFVLALELVPDALSDANGIITW